MMKVVVGIHKEHSVVNAVQRPVRIASTSSKSLYTVQKHNKEQLILVNRIPIHHGIAHAAHQSSRKHIRMDGWHANNVVS